MSKAAKTNRLNRFIFLSAAYLAVLSPSIAQTSISVPPTEPVAGISQADWSKAWWQWAGSFDQSDSPVADRTGKNCHLGQNGPVWFLAGTYGSKRTQRTCEIPRDKFVFFPLINYVVMPGTGDGQACRSCCATYIKSAKSVTDQPSNLVLDLDGRRIKDLATHRQSTKQCFDMGALAKPLYRIFPSAANGYYVMLRPLSPGRHVLNFGGELPGLSQALTYSLLVR
ncbi:MAG: hypothetical protein ABI790_11400 [Betaproteobacteria bacterium]